MYGSVPIGFGWCVRRKWTAAPMCVSLVREEKLLLDSTSTRHYDAAMVAYDWQQQ
jgi:hypothetical protein